MRRRRGPRRVRWPPPQQRHTTPAKCDQRQSPPPLLMRRPPQPSHRHELPPGSSGHWLHWLPAAPSTPSARCHHRSRRRQVPAQAQGLLGAQGLHDCSSLRPARRPRWGAAARRGAAAGRRCLKQPRAALRARWRCTWRGPRHEGCRWWRRSL